MDRLSRAIAHLDRNANIHVPVHAQVDLDIFDLQADAEGWALKRAFRTCIKREPVPISHDSLEELAKEKRTKPAAASGR